MTRSARSIDPVKQIARLERRHRQLETRVEAFEARLSLTPQEQFDLRRLKKEKLLCKDELTHLR